MALLLLSGCGIIFNKEEKGLEKGTSIHYINPNYNIGDVHPFYDEKTATWYMFYLKPGDYASKLLVSKDMIKWEEKDINFEHNIPPTKYYVLGVIKDGDKYRSYYGSTTFHGSSESMDLLLWKNSPSDYKVPNDIKTFLFGACDSFTFYDAEEKVYRCISTAYRTGRNPADGNIDCSMALSSTSQNNLTSWTKDQRELIRFPKGITRPECSQMFKIGNRWYLFTSIYGRTNNGVGRPTYWIGDVGKKILENDWQSKPENSLDGDDLCAAQVAFDGKKNYMFGWIEKKWQGGDWGGHINLPHEVYQLSDGTLATRLDKTVGKKIRGKKAATIAKTQINKGDSVAFEGVYSRADIVADFTLSNSVASIAIGEIKIQINSVNSVISINKDENDPTSYFATYRVPKGAFNGNVKVRVIAEDDILEIFVNEKYALCARISDMMKDKKVEILASKGNVALNSASIYKLKFLEEIK